MRIPDIGTGASKANGTTGLGRHPGSQAGVLNAIGTGTF
jgi:hypothetical protein